MPTAHANHAAVVAAGFTATTNDLGATAEAAVRYEVTYEKSIVGGAQRSGGPLRAFGQGSSEANARTAAVAALNSQRDYRYGAAAAGGSKNQDGDALTVDAS